MRSRFTVPVVGVSVCGGSVCVVLVRASRVLWASEATYSEQCSLQEAIGELLAALPRTAWRPAVHTSVGPRNAQIRDLGDQVWTRDRKLAGAIVNESPRRYFLVNGTPVMTTSVQTSADGALVGAIDRPVVEAITAACDRHRLKLVSVTPAAVVLGYAICTDRAEIQDGDVSMIARYDGTRLASCRRIRSADLPPELPAAAMLHPGLQVLDDGARYAAAFGAALAGRSIQLTLQPAQSGSGGGWYFTSAVASFLLALAFALAAPPLAAAHWANAARTQRAIITRSGGRALDAERRLGVAVSRLNAMHSFAARKRSATLLLARLSEAIDHPSMLLSIQADTLGGTLVALTPRASALTAMLDSVTEIADIRMIGPVTLQAVAGPAMKVPPALGIAPQLPSPPMERVTVRFVWRDLLVHTPSHGSRP